jgi:hypothetical protein
MAFTFTNARKLNPEEVNPLSGLVSRALQGYNEGIKSAYAAPTAAMKFKYLPEQLEADIFAKKFGPLATIATTPMFLQNPQFQQALGQMLAKHMNFGGAGGGTGQGTMNPNVGKTYAQQTQIDINDAEKLAHTLSKAGKGRTRISALGGEGQNWLGDAWKSITNLLSGNPTGEKVKELVNPQLGQERNKLDTFYQGLKQRAIQTGIRSAAQAEEDFADRPNENDEQKLARIRRILPSLFEQEAQGTEPQGDQNTAVDVEEENDRANRDLTFASQLSEQIKEKTGHEISPDLIYNYMQRTPGKINIKLLLKAAGVR